MLALASTLSMRLYGGLRVDLFTLPVEILEKVLGVRLELEDDLELGGAYYSYAPYPLPDSGLVGVRLHLNDISDSGLTYATRPDLVTVLSIHYYGADLLDLGRLEWRLRAAFGDLFDVAAYSIQTRPPPEDPSHSSDIHWVEFAAAAGRWGMPLGDTPNLNCSIGFELAESERDSVLAAIAELNDPETVLRGVDSSPTSEARLHLTVRFDSPSLLELGRCAAAIESMFGDAVEVVSYGVSGDLLRDGSTVSLESPVLRGNRRSPP